MMKPTIHMNGSSAEFLLEGYMNAHAAGFAFLEALEKVEPHSRDYYPQSSDAFAKAYAEQKARFDTVAKILSETMALVVHVQNEIEARKRQRA